MFTNKNPTDLDYEQWSEPEEVLVTYDVGFYVPLYKKADGSIDRERIAETWSEMLFQWASDGTTPDGDEVVIHLDDLRECDECGRVTEAGEFPDWVNGKCEDCDPDIWDHPDNVVRMQDAD